MKAPGTGGRPTWAIIGAGLAVAVAGVVSAVAIPTPHPGGDNAGYLALAHSLTQGTGYTELWDPGLVPHTKYPPVLPLVLAGFMALGVQSWFTLKLLVAASAVSLAVLLAFLWVTERRGPVFGGLVAIPVLLSAGWLQASRWILTEPLFLVFTLGCLVAAERALGPEGGEEVPPSARRALLLGVAGLLGVLAFFTRSAGLPLVMALLAALLLARRFRAGAVLGGSFALLAGAWVFRGRRGGEGAYQNEFWMANPYDPELGTIGIGGLLVRMWENLRLYVGEVLPREWWGAAELPWLLALGGILLSGLAVAGWIRRLRPRPGPAELFVPLYLGLILLWPQVWSGDRFLLPLYPFVLFWAGEVIWDGVRRWGRGAAAGAASVAFVLLTLPSVAAWLELADDASACRRAATEDVFRCHGAGVMEFRDAAAWAGANLPDDAVVVNRKPRIFYVLGGTPGRIFPFSRDPDVLLAEADELGARFLLLDRVDGISGYYLPFVIEARPLAFCWIRGWGDGGGGTNLFGILPPEERREGPISELRLCPEDYRRSPPVEPRVEGIRVPILVSGGSGGSALSLPRPAPRRGAPAPRRTAGTPGMGRPPRPRLPEAPRPGGVSGRGRGTGGGRTLRRPARPGSPRTLPGNPGAPVARV
jgi:hypothetical protein